jgi:hypothetical protein
MILIIILISTNLLIRENRKEIGSWTGFRVFLREALDRDSVAVRDLFQKVLSFLSIHIFLFLSLSVYKNSLNIMC